MICSHQGAKAQKCHLCARAHEHTERGEGAREVLLALKRQPILIDSFEGALKQFRGSGHQCARVCNSCATDNVDLRHVQGAQRGGQAGVRGVQLGRAAAAAGAGGGAGAPAARSRAPAHCGAEAVSQCINCKLVAYCSRKCQKRHWRDHHKGRCFSPSERAAFRTPATAAQLWHASWRGEEAAVLDLSMHGANVNHFNTKVGCNALFIAAQEGHDAVVRARRRGRRQGNREERRHHRAFIAAQVGHDACVRALLDAGADTDHALNRTTRCTSRPFTGTTRSAALLDAGADKNRPSRTAPRRCTPRPCTGTGVRASVARRRRRQGPRDERRQHPAVHRAGWARRDRRARSTPAPTSTSRTRKAPPRSTSRSRTGTARSRARCSTPAPTKTAR